MIATIVSILIIIACLGIIGIVLIQNPKGGGISSSFGSLNQIGGVKQTTEGVEKVTWFLAVALVVLCVVATPFMKGGETKAKSSPESSVPMPQSTADIPQVPAAGNPPAAAPVQENPAK